ncbi:MAG: NfeD family protein [Dehalococcoidales bacterium]|nr:NfeD family protein [Dehalococcoidales bacterium]
MCHLVLLMPVAGLLLFRFLPLSSALPGYVVIALISALLYRLLIKTMKQPLRDGFQSLVGTRAEVVSKLTAGDSAQYLVRSHGEMWSAYSRDTFQPGEPVNITEIKGIGVVIERVGK